MPNIKSKLFFGIFICLILLLIGGGVWSFQQIGKERLREADRFNVPLLKTFLSKLSSWSYVDIKPYLSKKFITAFEEGEFQKELDRLSILGKVISFKHIRHVSHTPYKHLLFGECAVNKYSVSTQFENGKGVVIMSFNHCFKNVEVTFFQVHSKALPIKAPALQ